MPGEQPKTRFCNVCKKRKRLTEKNFPKRGDGRGYTCRPCNNNRNNEWIRNNRAQSRETHAKTRRAARSEVIQGLGARCACECGCSDSNLVRLEIHHKLGNGKDERQQFHNSDGLVNFIRRQGIPLDKYCLLCGSCHLSITITGGCEGYKESVSQLKVVGGKK